MQKIKILIVEDEMLVARDVAHYREDIGCTVIGIVMEGEAALDFLKQEKPDIILMDIHLKGKLDGVETVQEFQKTLDIPLVYMTANTDDASFERAKATQPFAFIEKPFKKRTLIRTIDLLIEQLLSKKATEDEKEIDSFVLNDRIFVREKNKMVKIKLTDILYMEAERAYSRIITPEKEFVLSLPLRSLEEKISAEFLMRVHRSYVVNLNHVDEMQDNYIQIHQKYIPVSRSYWEEFLRRVKVI